jgi:hypothetical protein
MKRIFLLWCVFSLAAVAAFAQGTVRFNNNGILAGNPPSIQVLNIDGGPLVGTNWVAQLYYGAPGSPESSLIPVNHEPAHFRAPPTTNPGTWAGGTRTLVGFPENSSVVLQVKVWDSALFPTYETASAADGITGKSIIFDYWICGPGNCSVAGDLMANFRGFTLRRPQGTVNFNNLLFWPSPDKLVYLGDPLAGGTPLVGSNYFAQLYYGAPGAPESSLIAVPGPPAAFRNPLTGFPGTWIGGTRTLFDFFNNGGPNDPKEVSLQVRVLDDRSYCPECVPPTLFIGKSAIFTYSIPVAGSPPDDFLMKNFRGFNLIAPVPPLSMTLSPNQNQLILSWPTKSVGFTLQSSPSLGPDAAWTDCTNAVLAGNQYLMIATVSSTNQFYRLKK